MIANRVRTVNNDYLYFILFSSHRGTSYYKIAIFQNSWIAKLLWNLGIRKNKS